MTTLRTAAQQALEALTSRDFGWTRRFARDRAIEALEAALAEPVLQTCNCLWDGEMQMQQCTLHEAHVDAIKEWAQRAKFAEKKLAALAEPENWELRRLYAELERCKQVCAATSEAWREEAALAEPVQEPRTIRMERVDRSTSQHWWSEAAHIRMPSPELYAAGDTVLCWVNEGDMVRAAQPKAEPVQEPVAWMYEDTLPKEYPYDAMWSHSAVRDGVRMFPVFAPPQRKPLTREKAIALWADKSDGPSNGEIVSYCRAIERAHGIGGNDE